ncbi:MAG TPA: divalent-cation tolerance protein CutA [Chlorobaculum sp.]|uniref:Periplasmic divalent cation tolerance protein CutA n=1 Tax=Chlorobaculum tepidum (strain ATCC 49652 / DSM 12025 / NBRC 103806 / TLS) TaxID=194439 RepID=Q8KC19_CHLTE|nr:divalent-cation tolerance protein CutA [Chlorobaculum tepidum]AAM72832.1 periplasmic divalent cation tolerance protein CutA [Chlorobaculum tepidum TLS]HBU22460.1 divalent-cation tolerance protein CutA [Chlorobaculum sp.]
MSESKSGGYCMVITTAPSREEAEKLAQGILENCLAACVHLSDIRSFFFWDGEMQNDDEVSLFIKTTKKRYDALESYIQEYHPYDVPEIIQLPITGGSPEYLAWLDAMTGSSK